MGCLSTYKAVMVKTVDLFPINLDLERRYRIQKSEQRRYNDFFNLRILVFKGTPVYCLGPNIKQFILSKRQHLKKLSKMFVV